MSTTGETSTVPVVPTVTTTVSSIGSDAVNSTLPSSSPTSSTIVLAPLTMDPYSSDTLYTCRKCRSWLFRGNQINVHEVHKHSFSRHRLAKDLTSQGQTASTASSSSLSTSSSGTMDDSIDEQPSSSSSSSCTSYFLHEPLGWMKETTEDIENKLNCYKCHQRVGTLKWAGNQCSCGTWITPAIQLYKKAIDFRYLPVTNTSNNTGTSITNN